MERIVTKDNSVTFRNEEFDETYHSVSGAEEEALKKYILPSLARYDIRGKDTIRILDVCFGLGYNSAAAIDEISKINKDIKIEITGLEIDRKILNEILDIEANFESYDKIKRCIKENYRYDDGKVKVQIILGDATETVYSLKEKFDFIFHDPFSTKKMPALWSEDFFKKIANVCREGSILTTYSCSKNVRQNLINARFKVEDVAPVGRRSPSTIAFKG